MTLQKTLIVFLCLFIFDIVVPFKIHKGIHIRSAGPLSDDELLKIDLYLRRYGYLTDYPKGSAILATNGAREDALERFQNFNNIPETGVYDVATAELFAKPRCGCPDIVEEFTDPSTPEAFSAFRRWNKNSIDWRINSFSSKITPTETQVETRRAFEVWRNAANLRFNEFSSGDVDIRIDFFLGLHYDGADNAFDGPGNVLGHAFLPPNGDTHFDEAERWVINSSLGIDYFTVAAHEFGHALGLRHSEFSDALMAPMYNGYDPNFTLHPDDVAGIQFLYGAPLNEATTKSSLTTTEQIETTTTDAITTTSETPSTTSNALDETTTTTTDTTTLIDVGTTKTATETTRTEADAKTTTMTFSVETTTANDVETTTAMVADITTTADAAETTTVPEETTTKTSEKITTISKRETTTYSIDATTTGSRSETTTELPKRPDVCSLRFNAVLTDFNGDYLAFVETNRMLSINKNGGLLADTTHKSRLKKSPKKPDAAFRIDFPERLMMMKGRKLYHFNRNGQRLRIVPIRGRGNNPKRGRAAIAYSSTNVSVFGFDKVWRMNPYNGRIYKRSYRYICNEFPGVPNGIDAAIIKDSNEILFFKRDLMYTFDIKENRVVRTENKGNALMPEICNV